MNCQVKRIIAMLPLLLLLPDPAGAADVRGKVEREAGYPASYIRVTIKCGGRRSSPVYTGNDGFYYLGSVAAGTCTLQVGNTKDKRVSFQIEVREPSTQVPTVKIP